MNLQYLKQYIKTEDLQELATDFFDIEYEMGDYWGDDHPACIIYNVIGDMLFGDKFENIKKSIFDCKTTEQLNELKQKTLDKLK